MLVRLASAAVLAPIVLAAVWAGPIYFTIICLLFGGILTWEWRNLCSDGEFGWIGGLMTIVVILSIAATAYAKVEWAAVILVAGAALVIGATCVAKAGRPVWLGTGCIYIGLPCAAMVWVHGDPDTGRVTLLWLLAVVWGSDTGAYLFGRMLGGPKLAPSISPNKTWSGFVGGVLTAVVVAAVVAILAESTHLTEFLLVSAVISVATHVGDLSESAIKRYFGVKDAGHIIPGHGGALDRVDGLLFAAPVTAGFVLVQRSGFWTWM